jgi:hypothetical protein
MWEEDEIPITWLNKRITAEEAGITDEEKAEICSGDELWTFRSPPDSWQLLAGRAGIVPDCGTVSEKGFQGFTLKAPCRRESGKINPVRIAIPLKLFCRGSVAD